MPKSTTPDILSPAPADFRWPRSPEAETFIRDCLKNFFEGHSFARKLSRRMINETSTEFIVWADHLLLPKKSTSEEKIKKAGLPNDFVDLPKVILSSEVDHISCAITVDRIEDFQKAHRLFNAIEGTPCSSYRRMAIPGEKGTLFVIERRGTQTNTPDKRDIKAAYQDAVKKWTGRKRKFDDVNEGMEETLQLAKELTDKLGQDMAACAFLEAERIYWQSWNKAGQIQKSRQDALGLGWANHDHHTFRSSRQTFPALIKILLTFGFKKRERFYAGAEAGWGAQVMENPNAGLVIFADVDLTPSDVKVDFSSQILADVAKPGTVGLWCALHGESILQAGMHHLEAQFDFDHLKTSLREKKINVMKPFSDFPFLKQAFTEGEQWTVSEERLDLLKKKGWLSDEGYEKIKTDGAVGSHLENLQRHDGFKGFNQRGVSDIIIEVNPERQALKKHEK